MLSVLVMASGLIVNNCEWAYVYGSQESLASLQIEGGFTQGDPYPVWPTNEYRILAHPSVCCSANRLVIRAGGAFRVEALPRIGDCDNCVTPPPWVYNPCGWLCGMAVVSYGGGSDYDNDGDSGTDADIESFFACIAGQCCPTCTPDFNGDGDPATDADIQCFFRVLAGGSC